MDETWTRTELYPGASLFFQRPCDGLSERRILWVGGMRTCDVRSAELAAKLRFAPFDASDPRDSGLRDEGGRSDCDSRVSRALGALLGKVTRRPDRDGHRHRGFQADGQPVFPDLGSVVQLQIQRERHA